MRFCQIQTMPIIKLECIINAPRDRVFDLARSIDLHQISAGNTNERAVAGRISGLIELNETVTWRAKHLGVYQHLTAKISAFDRPNHFTDEMVSGAFKRFKHKHIFESRPDGTTLMIDLFDYTAPFGILGKLADVIFLEAYMAGFLRHRNKVIKDFAESDKWKQCLDVSGQSF